MPRWPSRQQQKSFAERYTQIVLTIIAGLLTVIAIELAFVADGATVSQAHAQIPDTGLQRKQIVDEQRITNQRLSALEKHLKEGTIKVRIVQDDKAQDTPSRKVERRR